MTHACRMLDKQEYTHISILIPLSELTSIYQEQKLPSMNVSIAGKWPDKRSVRESWIVLVSSRKCVGGT
jgi:hypothetical protein